MASGWDPAGVIEGQSAGGNEAVQVRMMSQVLRPGVQHGKHADARAEMAWIGRDLQQASRKLPETAGYRTAAGSGVRAAPVAPVR